MTKRIISINDHFSKTGNLYVPIKPKPGYGVSYLQVCARYKHGKLVSLLLDPKNQEKEDYWLEWVATEGSRRTEWHLHSFDEIETASAYSHGWCKEHKCATMRIAVPLTAKYLWVERFSASINVGFIKQAHDTPFEP